MIAKREVFCSRNGSSDTNKIINVKNIRGTSTGPWQWSWIVIVPLQSWS